MQFNYLFYKPIKKVYPEIFSHMDIFIDSNLRECDLKEKNCFVQRPKNIFMSVKI